METGAGTSCDKMRVSSGATMVDGDEVNDGLPLGVLSAATDDVDGDGVLVGDARLELVSEG